MTKSEFEQRAAEMRARNLAARTRQAPPPSVTAISIAPAWTPTKQRIRVKEALAAVDFSDFDPALKAVKRVGTIETDRDGLIDLRGTGVQIAVSPELIGRGVVLCNAVLKGATKRGWMVKAGAPPGAYLRVSITGEQLDFIVEEKVEPIPDLRAAPGGRRPRRPTGNLQVTLGSGYHKVSVSDKRGTRIESKLETLFEVGEALAISIRAERDRLAAQQREYATAERRRWEIESRIRRLNENMDAWEKAERIRRYANSLADEASSRGPIEPESDLAKWLAWAERYADWTDPLTRPLEVKPQEFWD
jgi:hypothetical protein